MRSLYIRHHALSLLLLTLLALAMLLFLTAHPAQGDSDYIVQSGDTLGAIAARYGVSVDDIAQANSLANRNYIVVGQTLRIPTDEQAAPPAPAAVAPVASAPVAGPPTRLVIPDLGLDTAVLPAGIFTAFIMGQSVLQQEVPPYAAGWHNNSAFPGQGNTVLSGHHNIYGRVFGSLVDLEVGASITLWAADVPREYVVTQRMILPEEGMSIETRLANARWLDATPDSRLTLVTCWPAWTNTHRLVVVATEVR